MNKQFISEFISGKIIRKNNHDLNTQEMINLFPYCETVRKIDLFIKKENEDITFEELLPKVAMYSSNRKRLFLLLFKNSNYSLSNKISKKSKTNTSSTKKTFHNWIQSSSSNKKPEERTVENKKIIIQKNENTDDLMTETLAKLYLEQKHFDQAIRAYQILRLKYPKKSSLFASEIKKITKLKLKNK